MKPLARVSGTKVALSVREVAATLGVSTDKVYELVRANEIPHKRLGRLIIVPRQPFLEWLHTTDSWYSAEWPE